MSRLLWFFLVLSCFFSIPFLPAQPRVPETFHYRPYSFLFRKDSVHLAVLSKKGEEHVKKPLFLFIQGSLPKPAVIYAKEGVYSPFGFDPNPYLDQYHFVVIAKPGIPLMAPDTALERDFTYRDPATGGVPRPYCEGNHLDYYTDRNKSALAFLARQPWADKRRIVVAGHSEGATIGAALAAASKKVTHLVFLSGNPLGRVMTMLGQARRAETDREPQAENIFAYWQAILEDPANDDCSRGDSNKTTRSFARPPKDNLEKLKIPVLVGFGTADYSAPFNDFLRLEMMRQKKTNFAFKSYIGMEHNFFGLKENGTVDHQNFNWEKVAADMFQWLTNH
jgi:dienelactone hydrolase